MSSPGAPQQVRRVRREMSTGPALGSAVVTVLVGPESQETPFLIYESIICASSNLFKECLTRPCKESTERLVRLPTFEPETFTTYVQFLHTSFLFTQRPGEEPEVISQGTMVLHHAEIARLTRLYKLADYLEDPDCKDAIVDALVELMTDLRALYPTIRLFLSEDNVRFLYKHSQPGAPVRKLIVSWGLVMLDHAGFDPHREFVSDDPFLCDLYLAVRPFWLQEKSEEELPSAFLDGNRCEYHEHGGVGKRCYVERFRR